MDPNALFIIHRGTLYIHTLIILFQYNSLSAASQNPLLLKCFPTYTYTTLNYNHFIKISFQDTTPPIIVIRNRFTVWLGMPVLWKLLVFTWPLLPFIATSEKRSWEEVLLVPGENKYAAIVRTSATISWLITELNSIHMCFKRYMFVQIRF